MTNGDCEPATTEAAARERRDKRARFNESRRRLLKELGLNAAKVGYRGILAGGFGAALATILNSPAGADQTLDAHILQTASSLEIVLVNTYRAAVEKPFVTKDSLVLAAFSGIATSHHDAHRASFQAATDRLHAKIQTTPNAKYDAIAASARSNLGAAKDVIALLTMLEEVIAATYLSDMAMLSDTGSKRLLAKVAGVEAQHLAILRMFMAIINDGMPGFLNDLSGAQLSKLPPGLGAAAFPDPFGTTSGASPPDEGAVR